MCFPLVMKWLTAVAAHVMLCGALAGCGGSQPGPTPAPTPEPTPGPTPAPKPASEAFAQFLDRYTLEDYENISANFASEAFSKDNDRSWRLLASTLSYSLGSRYTFADGSVDFPDPPSPEVVRSHMEPLGSQDDFPPSGWVGAPDLTMHLVLDDLKIGFALWGPRTAGWRQAKFGLQDFYSLDAVSFNERGETEEYRSWAVFDTRVERRGSRRVSASPGAVRGRAHEERSDSKTILTTMNEAWKSGNESQFTDMFATDAQIMIYNECNDRISSYSDAVGVEAFFDEFVTAAPNLKNDFRQEIASYFQSNPKMETISGTVFCEEDGDGNCRVSFHIVHDEKKILYLFGMLVTMGDSWPRDSGDRLCFPRQQAVEEKPPFTSVWVV